MTALLENFSGSLTSLRKRLKASRFLTWWLAELSGMAPKWMRSTGPTLANYMLLPVEQVNGYTEKPKAADSRMLALTVSARHVLRKGLNLPLATEENLRQVLEFQVEQYTPFTLGSVYFGYVVRGRDFESGQLTVELVVVPRDIVDPAINVLTGTETEVKALFVEELLSEGALVNLLPATASGSAPSVLRRGVNPWLAGLVVILAMAALVIPPLIKREAVVRLLPWVDKGKTAAEAVSAVRRDLEARVEQHNYLLEKRQSTPAVIQIIEELTHILPDDTWVQVFDLKGKKIQLQGETASSSRLIALFEKSSMFREASFSSALFKGQLAGTERYQLEIQLRSAVKADSAAQPPMTGASAAGATAGKAP